MKSSRARTLATCFTLTAYFILTVFAVGSGCLCCIAGGHVEIVSPSQHDDGCSQETTSGASCRHASATHQASIHDHSCRCSGFKAGATTQYVQTLSAQTTVERDGSLSPAPFVRAELPQSPPTSYARLVSCVSNPDVTHLRSVVLII